MMKNKIYVYYLLTLIISSCAVSVRDGESNYKESDLPTKNEISLLDEFEEKELNEISLQAFEKRSIELSQDLLELIKIINNDQIDTTMRESANRQLNNLFVNNRPEITINGNPDNLLSISIDEDSLEFIPQQPFTKTEDGYYFNRLESSIGKNSGEKILVQTILRKREKSFGDEKRKIWEVLIQKVDLNYSKL